MKKYILLLMQCFVVLFVMGQGIVKEKQTITSKILNREVHYTIYLPADYNTSERSYPVTYLLHGYGDEDDGWVQFGEINRLADKAISDGTIPPMIIVTPDGFKSFYINAADGSLDYEDFFIKELIPFIEKTYKVKSEKRYRGVAGLSMGGYGALIYGLKYPQLFAAVAPLSAVVWSDKDIMNDSDNIYNSGLFETNATKNAKGADRITDAWLRNSPLAIIEKKSVEELSSVKYWIDCGDDDNLSIGNSNLHIALTNKKVPHEFRIRDGVHNWSYWRSGIINALSFIGNNFHQ
ncbi:MAG: alpha/beta hydrolase family protein [Bacteroidetes bacterium]|nr:alpha/beta hydrolase family protein [Bacteroidota bacterium]